MVPRKRKKVSEPRDPKSGRPNELSTEEQRPTNLRDCGSGYIQAFVTFLDILGFSQMVGATDPALLNQQLDAVFDFSRLSQNRRMVYAQPGLAPMLVQFSDSIIRIQPIPNVPDVRPHDLLVGEISALALTQGNLACNGIFVRGGLAFGEICVRPNRVFGPAFLRAYELECKFARYPRILVDERLCVLSAEHPFDQQEYWSLLPAFQERIGELMERNEDGQFSIQYLSHLFLARCDDNLPGVDVLRAHRDQIERHLTALTGPKFQEPRAKMRWAASYHNRWITTAFDAIDQREFQQHGRGLMVEEL